MSCAPEQALTSPALCRARVLWARRRRPVLAVATALALGWLLASDRTGLATSTLNASELLRAWAWVGLLVVGQQTLQRVGSLDLGAGALSVLSAVVALGLAGSLGALGAALAAVGVALMWGATAAVLIGATRACPALVTAVPLALVGAVTSAGGFVVAPDLLRHLARAPLGGVVPALAVVYAAALLGLVCRRPRALLGAHLAAAALWGVLGLWTAGALGVETRGVVGPAALGLGLALLAGDDALAGVLAGLAAALVLNAWELRGLGPTDEVARRTSVLAGVVLLAGLALGSTQAVEVEGSGVDAAEGRVVEDGAEGPPLAGPDGHQGDGSLQHDRAAGAQFDADV